MSSRPSVTKLAGTASSGPAGLGSAGVPPAGNAIAVSELARRVRQTIEQAHPLQWVAGEISGFTRASSGHWYFNLKDASAQVRCAMFRGRNQWMDWQPRNGDAVEARGLPTLYEARGEFQLVVEQLRP
ncbi:MAG: exodeoxyribonuclease VII large subunit, partial [Pseudomonadota bacterium]|nr:exodeoxyribonuclease VII large subunit [Pseudomonadota bacterium]